MSAGASSTQPSRSEQIARVAHDALRTWRIETGGQPLPEWSRSPKHRNLAIGLVDAALAGAPAPEIHALRVEAKLAPPWNAATEDQRRETLLVQAIATTLGCGVERWDVKTGTDALAADVVLQAAPATIAGLCAFAPPPPDPPTRQSGAPEEQVYVIEATVTACKEEADSDYHLALSDGQGNTMIAEAVCPGCASGSPWLPQITAVRVAVEAAIPGITPEFQQLNLPAKITGVGFFDRLHGQTGVAPNGIELHPILAIEFGGTS